MATYVDPELGLKERRQTVGAWGFGVCMCERCVEEQKHYKEPEGMKPELQDLETELKAGLGIM